MGNIDESGEQTIDLKLLIKDLPDTQKDKLLEILKKEKDERIETKQKIILPANEDNETDQELIDNFLSHSDEEYKQMGKEIEEAEKRREKEREKLEIPQKTIYGEKWDEQYSKNTKEFKENIPQELINFRKKFEERIKRWDKEIIKGFKYVAENTQINVQKDTDGSKIVKFKLGSNTYTILQPNLENYTDDKYKRTLSQDDAQDYSYIDEIKYPVQVYIDGIWKGVDKRYNEKLENYVKKKEKEGLKLSSVEEIRDVLGKLRNKAGEVTYHELREYNHESTHISLFIYITGIEGNFFLKKSFKSIPEIFNCFVAGSFEKPSCLSRGNIMMMGYK